MDNFNNEEYEEYANLIEVLNKSFCTIITKREKINKNIEGLLTRMIYNNKVLFILIIHNSLIDEEDLYKSDEFSVIKDDKEIFKINHIGVIFRENKKDGVTLIEIISPGNSHTNLLLEIDFNCFQKNEEDKYINNPVYLINHPYEILKREIKNINLNDFEIEKLNGVEKISVGNPILIKSNTIKLLGLYKGNNDNYHLGTFLKEPIQEFIKKYNDSILIIYKTDTKKDIQLFNEVFVKNYKEKCKLIIKGRIREMIDKIVPEKQDLKKKKFHIKLINIQNLKDLEYMFFNCDLLYSLPDLEKFNRLNICSTRSLFNSCRSLEILSDISNWNTLNLTDMRYMFSECESLKELPDISKWKIDGVTNIEGLFYACKSLKSLPDISKWNTLNVSRMNDLFNGLKLITSLPDIYKWKTNNVGNMANMFEGCLLLKTLPDISKWDISSCEYMKEMFKNCKSLEILPDISKWNTSNVTNLMDIFKNCSSLTELPDISNWNTEKVRNISGMFDGCKSLIILPDISNWKTNEVINISNLFRNCSSLSTIPDISKWNIEKVTDMSGLFKKCSSLSEICDLNRWKINRKVKTQEMFDFCLTLTYLPYKYNNANNRKKIECLSLLLINE